MFVSFKSDLVKKFEAKLQDIVETGKLSQFFKSTYEAAPAAEWTDVAEKLLNLEKPLLQMEIFDLQEDIPLPMYKTASPEEFWLKNGSEK